MPCGAPFGDVDANCRRSVHQSGGVIRVVVAEDDGVDVGEREAERLQVARDGVLVGAGVEEDAAAIDFDQRRESPLTETIVGQHGRKNLDFEALHTMRRLGLISGDRRTA